MIAPLQRDDYKVQVSIEDVNLNVMPERLSRLAIHQVLPLDRSLNASIGDSSNLRVRKEVIIMDKRVNLICYNPEVGVADES